MRILLDPSRDGCTVWFLSRNTVKFIKGRADEVCERLYDFTTYYDEDIKQRIQCVDIILDWMGIGTAYQDILENRYKLKISLIKTEHELKL
jgi:hypothetical protein